jgi:hypothetical protein
MIGGVPVHEHRRTTVTEQEHPELAPAEPAAEEIDDLDVDEAASAEVSGGAADILRPADESSPSLQ